jgi:kinesin family protein 4/21/27
LHINSSLQSLGNVIKLIGRGVPLDKVPYDDNNLTKAMRDSIGGRARTLMIVSMSPSEYDLQETMDSLKFAQTTGQIKNIVEQQSTLMIPL